MKTLAASARETAALLLKLDKVRLGNERRLLAERASHLEGEMNKLVYSVFGLSKGQVDTAEAFLANSAERHVGKAGRKAG